MNLEHYQKDAKRLLRAFRAGDPGAMARADEALGARARARFLLTDAQYVIAVELGYRSWPDFKRTAEHDKPVLDPARGGQARTEALIDTGLEYWPGDPVRVRVVRRGQRILVSDDGAAVEKAGRPPRWRDAVDRVDAELDVNINHGGVISLPVVRVGPSEPKIVRRIGEASLGLYQELLELEDEVGLSPLSRGVHQHQSGMHDADDPQRSRGAGIRKQSGHRSRSMT